jgi:hypothetical protein
MRPSFRRSPRLSQVPHPLASTFPLLFPPLPNPLFYPTDKPTPEEDVEDIDIKAEGATLEPKDMFSHRPLPFIIGTDPFHEDEYIGLMEEEEEEEEIIEEQPAPTAPAPAHPDADESAASGMMARQGEDSDLSEDEEEEEDRFSDEEQVVRPKRV